MTQFHGNIFAAYEPPMIHSIIRAVRSTTATLVLDFEPILDVLSQVQYLTATEAQPQSGLVNFFPVLCWHGIVSQVLKI